MNEELSDKLPPKKVIYQEFLFTQIIIKNSDKLTQRQRERQTTNQPEFNKYRSLDHQFYIQHGDCLYLGRVTDSRKIEILKFHIDLSNSFDMDQYCYDLNNHYICENGCKFIEQQGKIVLLIVTQQGQIMIKDFTNSYQEFIIDNLERKGKYYCMSQSQNLLNQLKFSLFSDNEELVEVEIQDSQNIIETRYQFQSKWNYFKLNIFNKQQKSFWKKAFELQESIYLIFTLEQQFQIQTIQNKSIIIIPLEYTSSIQTKNVFFYPHCPIKPQQHKRAVGTIIIIENQQIEIIQLCIEIGKLKESLNINQCNIQNFQTGQLNQLFLIKLQNEINPIQVDNLLNSETLFLVSNNEIFYFNLYSDELVMKSSLKIAKKQNNQYQGIVLVNDMPLVIYKTYATVLYKIQDYCSSFQKALEQETSQIQQDFLHKFGSQDLNNFFQKINITINAKDKIFQYLTIVNFIFNSVKPLVLDLIIENPNYQLQEMLTYLIDQQEDKLIFIKDSIGADWNQEFQQIYALIAQINQRFRIQEFVQIDGIDGIEQELNSKNKQRLLSEIAVNSIEDYFKLNLNCLLALQILIYYEVVDIKQIDIKQEYQQSFKRLVGFVKGSVDIKSTIFRNYQQIEIQKLDNNQIEMELIQIIKQFYQNKQFIFLTEFEQVPYENRWDIAKLMQIEDFEICQYINMIQQTNNHTEMLHLVQNEKMNNQSVITDYLSKQNNYQEFNMILSLYYLNTETPESEQYNILKNAIKSNQFKLTLYLLQHINQYKQQNEQFEDLLVQLFCSDKINILSNLQFTSQFILVISDFMVRNLRKYFEDAENLNIENILIMIMNQVSFLSKFHMHYHAITLLLEYVNFLQFLSSSLQIQKIIQIQTNLLALIVELFNRIQDPSVYSQTVICQINRNLLQEGKILLEFIEEDQEQEELNQPCRTVVHYEEIVQYYCLKKNYQYALSLYGEIKLNQLHSVLIYYCDYRNLIDLWENGYNQGMANELEILYVIMKDDTQKSELFLQLISNSKINQKIICQVFTKLVLLKFAKFDLDLLFDESKEKQEIIKCLLEYKQIELAQHYGTKLLEWAIQIKNQDGDNYKQIYLELNIFERLLSYEGQKCQELKNIINSNVFLQES